MATNSGSGYSYQAEAVVSSTRNLRAMMEAFEDRVLDVVPSFFNGRRLIKLALVAATRNPKILECTQETVIQAVMTAAELGLDISPATGEAYLVPYYNNRERRSECQLIIGYRGLVKMAFRGDEIRRIDAAVVYENDVFEYEEGTRQMLRHRPTLKGDRGEKIGVYSLAETVHGGIQIKYLRKEDVEKVKGMSKMSGSGPWKEWEDEMWMKTAFRNLSKWLPISSEDFSKAIEISDREFDLSRVRRQVREATGLNDRLNLPSAKGESIVLEEEEAEVKA